MDKIMASSIIFESNSILKNPRATDFADIIKLWLLRKHLKTRKKLKFIDVIY